MQTFALIHPRSLDLPFVEETGALEIGGRRIPIGVVDVPEPEFDPQAEDNAHMVIVRVDAMSCNFRDKSIMMLHAEQMDRNPRLPYAFIGSEFGGTVVAVGSQVTRWSPGDQVLPDAQYPDPPAAGVRPGIVTNHAGAGWLRVHESKLLRRPPGMSAVQAAGFSLGAQTSMSMVRKAGIGPEDRVLVTSARANTSRFLLAALRSTGAKRWAASTSEWSESEHAELHGATLLRSRKAPESLFRPEDIEEVMGQGGFTVVLDPFFDLHVERVMDLLAIGGRYVTCGLQGQHPGFAERADVQEGGADGMTSLDRVLLQAMMKNISLIGNCIGTSADLHAALCLFGRGEMNPPHDTTFRAGDGAGFLRRTYVDPGRQGKVIMEYA